VVTNLTCLLLIQVVNKHDDQSLGVCKVSLADLLHSADMTSSRPYHLRESGTDTTVTLHLCLRVNNCAFILTLYIHGLHKNCTTFSNTSHLT